MWRLLLTNGRFRRLFLAETVMNFGETAVYLSLAIWVKDLTGSTASAGIVFLAITVPGLAGPVLGHFVDRVRGRRMLMIRMYLGMAVLFLALLAVRGPDQVWIIYSVAFAYGVLSNVPARPALLKDFLPSEDAAPARSLLFTAAEGVRIVSPAIGAGVYLALGGGSLAVLGAGTFVAAALLLATLQVEESPPEPAGERFRTSVVAGFRYIRRVSLLLRLSLAAVAFMAVVGLLETAIFAANEALGMQAAFFGVITSVQGGGSVAGGLLAGRLMQRWSETRSSTLGYALMAVGLLLCLLQNVWLFLIGVVIFGLGMPFVLIALGTAFHLYTPSRIQGRANAAVGTVTGAAQTISIAVGVALIGVLGHQVMYLAVACTAVLCAGWLFVGRIAQPEVVKSLADEDAADQNGADGADGAAVDGARPADAATDAETSR